MGPVGWRLMFAGAGDVYASPEKVQAKQRFFATAGLFSAVPRL
ncbi:hypothetical protein CSIRO_0722 [Bradyrhizobiaceae bacterium SG-6C]|nr:hypothetical protein CSIRO_0722 [Bradyrhizobiaceae bacterium SG-6C]